MGKGSGVLKKRVFRSLFVTILTMPLSSALAADVPNIFVGGDTASASEVNANFKDLSDRAFDKAPTGISYSEGNVGIGTTSPRAKLDVVEGNVNTAGMIVRKRTSAWNLAQIANLGSGGFNPISSDGNVGIIFSNGAANSDTDLVIAPWSSEPSGIKIQADGNVGIGTANPKYKLHVNGNIQANAGAYTTVLYNTDAGAPRNEIYFSDDEGTSFSIRNMNNKFDILNFEGSTGITLDGSSGNVGIGTTSPSYKLHVNGTAAGTSWTNLSSRDYKEGIQKVDESKHSVMLASLMDMDLTTYKYKEEYGGDDTTKLGFIAEEMPREVLSKDGKGVDVYELLTFTIGAMKAQQEEIKGLNAKLKQNEALEARLAKKVEALLNAAQ